VSGVGIVPADSSAASGAKRNGRGGCGCGCGCGCGVGVGVGVGVGAFGCRDAGGSMRRSQNDYTAGVDEYRDSVEQPQHRRHHHQRVLLPSTSIGQQQTGRRMSLETLLQAAYYVEQEEKKRERLASTSSSSSSCDQHSFAPAPTHSNHTYASSEPRGEYHALLELLHPRPFALRFYAFSVITITDAMALRSITIVKVILLLSCFTLFIAICR